MVVGDGNITLDTYVRDPRQTVFIQNVADWLVQSESLISPSRSKNSCSAHSRVSATWDAASTNGQISSGRPYS